MEKLTVITTFSGIGMQERGLINSKCFDVDILATSDIDKNAILSYAAIHCGLTMDLVKSYPDYPPKEAMIKELTEKNIGFDFEKKKATNWKQIGNKKDDTELKKYWLAVHLSKNLGDISKVKELPYADMLTFSFPCTDISVAGQQKGLSFEDWQKGTSTRSGLVWEIIRLLKIAKINNQLPKYLLMENVTALLSKNFFGDFLFLNRLINEIGYDVYYKEINGKNTGVPQNRPRVFGMYIRKDIDKRKFYFPKPFDKGLRLADVLEKNVDDKYFLSQFVQDRFVLTDKTFTKNIIGTTKTGTRIGQHDVVYQTNGVIGCLMATDYKQPKQIIVKTPNKCHTIGKIEIKANETIKRIFAKDGICPTLTTMQGGYRQPKIINEEDFSIRKITPSECFVLMGLTKEDCKKCQNMGESDSSLYKQAGNGIITNCIKLIAEHLYKAQYDENYKCEDEIYNPNKISYENIGLWDF